jgi:hypothetical protein
LSWSGPDPRSQARAERLSRLHAPDWKEWQGRLSPDAAADAFCLRGGPAAEIVGQLLGVLGAAPAAFDYVCLHPIPNPASPDDPERGFMARVAREILPPVRAALGAGGR